MQRHGHLLARMQGVVHEHGVADIDEQDRLAVRGELLAVNGKIFRFDPQGNSLNAPLHRIHQGLTDVHVERISVFISLGLVQHVPLKPPERGWVLSPAISVKHLKDLSQGLIPDHSHSLWAESQALSCSDQVAFLFQHLFHAPQVLEVFVGLLSQQVADLLQVKV